MLVLLSCAKTMSAVSKVKVPLTTIPRFQKEAAEIALQMSQFSVDELERLLRVNAKIAVENYKRYQAFHAETTPELPALLAYTGIVFKRLNPKDFSAEDFGYAQEQLTRVTKQMTLAHPTWRMGQKITVDSATLMNKGFEVIEAVHLFGVAPEQVQVVVHRESIVHSMVEYVDRSVIAQLSVPDMRHCVQYALTHPHRLPAGDTVGELDLFSVGKLTFCPPDTATFPLLALAVACIRRGGALPAVLNAANEVVVDAFLHERIRFCDIPGLVTRVTEQLPDAANLHLYEEILSADRAARETARTLLSRI